MSKTITKPAADAKEAADRIREAAAIMRALGASEAEIVAKLGHHPALLPRS